MWRGSGRLEDAPGSDRVWRAGSEKFGGPAKGPFFKRDGRGADLGALHLDEAVGAELRRPVGALRGRLRDGAEVGEEPAPRLGQVDELLERGVEGLRVKRRELEPAYKHIGAAFGLLREEGVNFRGVGRGSAGYGSMAIRVDEQCPSTPTVVVQENLIGRAGGLEYLIVTAPVSLSLESS